MPYVVVYAWDGGKPARKATWTLGSAEAAMLDTLRAANARGGELDVRVVDRATGETVVEPQRCLVCRDRWATEVSRTDGGYALCGTCDEDDLPAEEPTEEPVTAEETTEEPVTAEETGLVRPARSRQWGEPIIEPARTSSPAAPAAPDMSAPLVAALRSRKLDPAVQPDGAVTVTANDIEWTLKPVPHAVTGGPCGVWSAIGPRGPRGQFVAHNAASFIARRTTP